MSPFPGGVQGFKGPCCFLPPEMSLWAFLPETERLRCHKSTHPPLERVMPVKGNESPGWWGSRKHSAQGDRKNTASSLLNGQHEWKILEDFSQQDSVHLLRAKDMLLRLLSSLTFRQLQEADLFFYEPSPIRNVTSLCGGALGLISLFSLFWMFLFSFAHLQSSFLLPLWFYFLVVKWHKGFPSFVVSWQLAGWRESKIQI